MHRKSFMEILVGLFMLAGILSLIFLVFKVSGLAHIGHTRTYTVYADFDNVGGLKPRAPVTIGGVKIGEVGPIRLDSQTFRAKVSLFINDKFKEIPSDSSAGIYTQGILGSNYISITPGFANDWLKNGSEIENTRSAIILENLIGQFMYSMTNKNTGTAQDTGTSQQKLRREK